MTGAAKRKKTTARPVDLAMDQERAEKITMRSLWLDQAKSSFAEHGFDDEPFYLTLSGADGKEIEQLVTEGLIKLTETGAIAEESKNQIVAIEHNPQAQIKLLQKFPGLKVIREPVQNMLSGLALTRFPVGGREKDCRARIVNLDLNVPCEIKIHEGEVVIPLVIQIIKLGQIHAVSPRKNWLLFLTLHGEVTWPEEICQMAIEYLSENFERVSTFSDACKTLLGDELHQAICDKKLIDCSSLDVESQQKLLMAYVPKAISQHAHSQGWRVTTHQNLRYGTPPKHAPMVSWIFEFSGDRRSHSNPSALYQDCIAGILNSAARIDSFGEITPA